MSLYNILYYSIPIDYRALYYSIPIDYRALYLYNYRYFIL